MSATNDVVVTKDWTEVYVGPTDTCIAVEAFGPDVILRISDAPPPQSLYTGHVLNTEGGREPVTLGATGILYARTHENSKRADYDVKSTVIVTGDSDMGTIGAGAGGGSAANAGAADMVPELDENGAPLGTVGTIQIIRNGDNSPGGENILVTTSTGETIIR